MNRCALCIRLLQILNSRDFVTKKQLAELLETNPRNITEYLKELEVAGYKIETTRGKYAGYRLKENALLPASKLSFEENKSLHEALTYLSCHPDFLPIKDYTLATEKILSVQKGRMNDSSIVFLHQQSEIYDDMRPSIESCRQAQISHHVVRFSYKSMRSNCFEWVELQPYEILNVNGEYYCLGYNRKKTSYRFYKFSSSRMSHFEVLEKTFQRDIDFQVHHYLGQSGLMKQECYEIECIIEGDLSLLIHEKGIGIHPIMEWISEKQLHVKTLVEGKMNALQLLCSLGNHCKLLAPESLKQEMKQIIQEMSENYQ